MTAIPLENDHEIEYPETDGEPMGETDLHIDEIEYLRIALRERYRDAPDVYVASNLLLFYQKGHPETFIVPDVFVAWGVSKEFRRNYLLWEEGAVPRLVVEVTSRSSRSRDVSFKKDLYERLGVEEYFLFDPYREYLRPPLQGFRLGGRRYRRIPEEADGSLLSTTLGVAIRNQEFRLLLTDLATGVPLLRPQEMAAAHRESEEALRQADEARRQADEARRQADEARRQAEERVRALEEEIDRLRGA